jgi:hypothetical protein
MEPWEQYFFNPEHQLVPRFMLPLQSSQITLPLQPPQIASKNKCAGN